MHTGREDRETGSQSDRFIASREHTGGEGHTKTTTGSICVCVCKDEVQQDGGLD